MLQTLIRRAAEAAKFDFQRNPYKAKRSWPPDFTQLSQKHQFRLERRYRRRAKLKWARPAWTKFVKLATWGTISFVVVYGVVFMETDEEGSPFDAIRAFLGRTTSDIFNPRKRDPVPDVSDRHIKKEEQSV